MESTWKASNFLLIISLVLDWTALIYVGLVLEDKLFIDSVVGCVCAGNSILLLSFTVKSVVVLTHGRTCACTKMTFDIGLGNFLLSPGNDVLLRIHLISDILRVLERLNVLVMCVSLLR